MWQCNFCGYQDNSLDSKNKYRCSNCGELRLEYNEFQCPNCGSIYNSNIIENNFCATCGRQINESKIIKNNFEEISKLLLKEVAARFNQPETNKDVEFGDSFAELLEKLLIVNIRMWKLEDLASQEKDDKKLGELKRKIDFCFKEKRPKLIKAINSFLDTYITNYRKFFEENIKSYG